MTPASLKSNAVVMRPHDNTTPHALTDTSIDYVSGPSLRFRNLLSYKVVVMGDLNPHLDADSIAIDDDDDVDLLDDDVRVGITDGVPFIDFSPRIQDLAVKSLEFTLVLKILEHRVGYSTLYNCLISIWKSSKSIKLIVKINLRQPLISKIVIDGRKQLVEYESLPKVCFNCETYGHINDHCPQLRPQEIALGLDSNMPDVPTPQPLLDPYGP
ncbi:hypothetical protein V6N12_058723 [Hibiscus sabdariffa]|uniref:CCHC-type domain-containing protein n=1 Tax=Hibiscus sabdariffa TaxID=183260 RepID=A0ABR2ET00_9ROSI